jgi:hypothetical protein
MQLRAFDWLDSPQDLELKELARKILQNKEFDAA